MNSIKELCNNLDADKITRGFASVKASKVISWTIQKYRNYVNFT